MSLIEIMRRDPEERMPHELQHLQLYMQFKVPFFKEFNSKILMSIAACMHLEQMHKGQVVMKAGDVGEEMYVIYQGRCEVFRETELKKQSLAVINPNGVIGETAIESEEPKLRSASCRVASDSLIAFRLAKEDYRHILSDLHATIRVQRHRFLQSVPLLKSLNTAKLNDINTAAGESSYQAGDVIYEIGH